MCRNGGKSMDVVTTAAAAWPSDCPHRAGIPTASPAASACECEVIDRISASAQHGWAFESAASTAPVMLRGSEPARRRIRHLLD